MKSQICLLIFFSLETVYGLELNSTYEIVYLLAAPNDLDITSSYERRAKELKECGYNVLSAIVGSENAIIAALNNKSVSDGAYFFIEGHS